MVEINESERIKEKRIKRNEDNLRDLQDNVMQIVLLEPAGNILSF